MGQIIINYDDEIEARIRAAYGVSGKADLGQEIMADVKSKVVAHEVGVASQAELAKIRAAEDARQVKVATAESRATSEIVLT